MPYAILNFLKLSLRSRDLTCFNFDVLIKKNTQESGERKGMSGKSKEATRNAEKKKILANEIVERVPNSLAVVNLSSILKCEIS